MIRTLKYTTVLAATVLLAAACSRDKTETPSKPRSDMPICWNIETTDDTALGSRALIGNEDSADTYCIPLSRACTPSSEGGPGFAVGLFGDYTYTHLGRDVTEADIFRGARLVYSDNAGQNPFSSWNYEAEDQYWYPGGQYVFRAYYPQKMYNYTVSTSNATTLAIVYPTRKQQYDLLLGYATADTNDPETMRKAVSITMRHALAALRFRFRLGFEDEDMLTSCFLLNDEGRKFCSQGTVVYGSASSPESVAWLQDYNPPATEEVYKWVHPAGIPMKSECITGIDEKALQYDYTIAEAYTQYDAAAEGETGELFCRNSGWLLIIPQESYGTCQLCFTTRQGGESLYKIALPTVTERDEAGNPVSTAWEAGKRYTYTVTLSKSDIDINVAIEDWNQRKHSTQIVF